MEIKFTISVIISVLNLSLGLIVLLKNRRALANIFYFVLCLAGTFWGLCLSMYNFVTDPNLINNFIVKLIYTFATIAPWSYLMFAYNFPISKKIVNKKTLAILPLPLVIIFLVWLGIYIPEGVVLVNGKIEQYSNQGSFQIFALYFFIYFLLAMFELLKKLKNSDPIYRRQILGIVLATASSFITIGLVSILLPIIYSFQYDWLGPILLFLHFVFIFRLLFSNK